MTARLIGFHPARMAILSTRTSQAIEQLRGITSSDVSARPALSRVDSVRFELETRWMPAIARVTGDRSMLDWEGEEPDPTPTPFDQLLATTTAAPPDGDFVSQDHGDLIGVLVPPPPRATTGREWDSLAPWQQEWLIANRPDLVFAYVLEHGIELTPEQLGMLDAANRFVQFSDSFLAKFGLEVGVRWFALELGGTAELIVMHMSDGTVHVMLAEKGTFGVSADVGNIEIGAGIYGKAGQTLVFPSEEAAGEAIDMLIAASDQSLWENAVDTGVPIVINVLGLLPSWTPVPYLPPRSDVQKKIDELWDEYGEEETDEVGVYVSAHGELAGALDVEGDASLEAGVYTTADGDGNVTQEGVRVTGSVSGSASAGGAGATVTAEASFVLDVHTATASGDEFATLTLTAGGGTGVSAELVDMAGPGVDIGAVAIASSIVTTTITVPVNAATLGNVVDIVHGVRAGTLPADALDELHDDADITITVDQVMSQQSSVSIDGGAAGFSTSTTVSHGDNVGTWHKFPGGQMYSQTEIAAAIDAANPAEASGSHQAGGGSKSW